MKSIYCVLGCRQWESGNEKSKEVDVLASVVMSVFIALTVPIALCNNAAKNKQEHSELFKIYEQELQKVQRIEKNELGWWRQSLSKCKENIKDIASRISFYSPLEKKLKTDKKQNRSHKSKDELIKEIKMLYDFLIKYEKYRIDSLCCHEVNLEFIKSCYNRHADLWLMLVINGQNILDIIELFKIMLNHAGYFKEAMNLSKTFEIYEQKLQKVQKIEKEILEEAKDFLSIYKEKK